MEAWVFQSRSHTVSLVTCPEVIRAERSAADPCKLCSPFCGPGGMGLSRASWKTDPSAVSLLSGTQE